MVSESKAVDELSVPKITLCLYNSLNNYSIVAYNANFHVDVFIQGIPSLTNRKILIIKVYSTKNGSQRCKAYPREFHFTFLDWGRSIKF